MLSKCSGARKLCILKQGADGMPVADNRRKAGITQATDFNWKKKYDALLPAEMRRLRQLEEENAKPHEVVFDLTAGKEMLRGSLRGKRWGLCCDAAGPVGAG